MYEKAYMKHLEQRIADPARRNDLLLEHIGNCQQYFPTGLLRRHPKVHKMIVTSSVGKVHPYCFRWKYIGRVIRDEKIKLKVQLSKYSQRELDVGKEEEALNKILQQSTCDNDWKFPLELAYHVGSTGERYAEGRAEMYEEMKEHLHDVRNLTHGSEDKKYSIIHPPSCSLRDRVVTKDSYHGFLC